MHHARRVRTLPALIVAVALSVAACSGDDGSPVPVRPPATSPTAVSTPTATPATTATATAEATLDATATATAVPEAGSGTPSPTPTPSATVATVATVTATPAPAEAPLAVGFAEAFGGREFDRPIEIGVYPVGPEPGSAPGMFLAEQDGRILVLHPDADAAAELLDISDQVSRRGNEEGLLSVALDPRFDESGRLWVYYSASGVPRMSRLARFTVDPADPLRVVPDSELVIIEVEQPYSNHNGGAIRFGPDGMLYLGYGDGGSGGDPRGHGQNLATLLGSVIRIDVRDASRAAPYAVPPDNPFVGVEGARTEIWAYGNYGWNRLEGTRCFARRSRRGHYLFSSGRLWALPLDGGEVVEIAVSPRPVSSFGTDGGVRADVRRGGAADRAPLMLVQGVPSASRGPHDSVTPFPR